jgi:ribokinase
MNLDISVQVEDIPQPGETVLGFNLAQSPGGKGSNQAAAASLSGAQTHLVAVVGEDEFGSQLIAKAQGIGIDTQFVSRTLGQKTGTALITVDSKGENSREIRGKEKIQGGIPRLNLSKLRSM